MDFGLEAPVKLNFVKYFLLVVGVVVALIIALTSFRQDGKKTEERAGAKTNQPKLNLSVFRFTIQKF